MSEYELYHYGVKGMKWGVRKDRTASGSSNTARRKTSANSGDRSARNKEIAKKVAGMVVMGATVSAVAVLYAKNRKAVNSVVAKAGKTTLSALKTGKNKAVEAGKTYVRETISGVKEGVKEGIREAPKKAAKAVITGVTLNAAKRMLDSTVGKEEAARIFQANNNKKISSFWKVSQEDRDKEDDD